MILPLPGYQILVEIQKFLNTLKNLFINKFNFRSSTVFFMLYDFKYNFFLLINNNKRKKNKYSLYIKKQNIFFIFFVKLI